MSDAVLTPLALLAVGLPTLSFGVLALSVLSRRQPSERFVARLTAWTLTLSFLASVALTVATLRAPAPLVLPLGTMFQMGDYRFELNFVLDGLSVAMLTLSSAICGLAARFSVAYLHREAGFARFFALLNLFASAMMFLVLSGGIDQLFLGWELVGFTSWLLIAFFWQRKGPVDNGLRAFITYRACDAGLLLGAVLLHHFAHTADAHSPSISTHYPIITTHVEPAQATLVALCLLLAAMGKSAQFPFSGFLPRAMEGPTPSSALFYGALSVHAGAYLLLRAQPLLDVAPYAPVAITIIGLLTAFTATLSARVQSDVKSALGYAVVAQTGLIFAEIGLGLYRLALVHMVAHAILRTLQLLRAPSALAAARQVHALSGGARFTTGALYRRVFPLRLQRVLYRAALERFYLDVVLERFVVAPVLRLALWLERGEQRWCNFLCHLPSATTPSAQTPSRELTSHARPGVAHEHPEAP